MKVKMAVWRLWGGRRLGAFLAVASVCGLLPKWRAVFEWLVLGCGWWGGGMWVCALVKFQRI